MIVKVMNAVSGIFSEVPVRLEPAFDKNVARDMALETQWRRRLTDYAEEIKQIRAENPNIAIASRNHREKRDAAMKARANFDRVALVRLGECPIKMAIAHGLMPEP